jgi:hypothetical protein
MGIFNVSMPLLYGEGGVKAFRRLQAEIIKESNDQSIILHSGPGGLLASSPDEFLPNYVFQRALNRQRYLLDSIKLGLRVSLLLYPLNSRLSTLAIVESIFANDLSELCRPAILLYPAHSEDTYYRMSGAIFKVGLNARGDMEVVNTLGP